MTTTVQRPAKIRVLKEVSDERILHSGEVVANYTFTARDGHQHVISIGPLITTKTMGPYRSLSNKEIKREREVVCDGVAETLELSNRHGAKSEGPVTNRVGAICWRRTYLQYAERVRARESLKHAQLAESRERGYTAMDNWEVAYGSGGINITPLNIGRDFYVGLSPEEHRQVADVFALLVSAPDLLAAVDKNHPVLALLAQRKTEILSKSRELLKDKHDRA